MCLSQVDNTNEEIEFWIPMDDRIPVPDPVWVNVSCTEKDLYMAYQVSQCIMY